MGFEAKVILDSISPKGKRLTTFEVCFPRIVLAEFNTHRVFSRNSASSRAIPVTKMLEKVMEDPYVPSAWGKNQKGMQATEDVALEDWPKCDGDWLLARDYAVQQTKALLERGVHKQTTNRLLEPFMFHTVVCSSTELSNFIHLRDNPAAHPDIQRAAHMMVEVGAASEPRMLLSHQWHRPYIHEEDEQAGWALSTARGDTQTNYEALLNKTSSARCGRVSYLTHDGRRALEEDEGLAQRLLDPGHMSPFEHVARPMTETEFASYYRVETVFDDGSVLCTASIHEAEAVAHETGRKPLYYRDGAFCGNFNGWVQFRKLIPGEDDILGFRNRQ
jgi:hypothetical protein